MLHETKELQSINSSYKMQVICVNCYLIDKMDFIVYKRNMEKSLYAVPLALALAGCPCDDPNAPIEEGAQMVVADGGDEYKRPASNYASDGYDPTTCYVFTEDPANPPAGPLESEIYIDPPATEDTGEVAYLQELFLRESQRQIDAVQRAGGYCKLPKSFPANDTRLGDDLAEIALQRDHILRGRDEDERLVIFPYWVATLPRAECDAVHSVALKPGVIHSARVARQLTRNLTAAAARFNDLCVETQIGGGSEDEFALQQVFIARGEAIASALTADGKPVMRVMDKWAKACERTEDPYTPQDADDFLASRFLAEQVLQPGGSRGYGVGWLCPYDIDGFNRSHDNLCGGIQRCVVDSDTEQKPGTRIEGNFEDVDLPDEKRSTNPRPWFRE